MNDWVQRAGRPDHRQRPRVLVGSLRPLLQLRTTSDLYTHLVKETAAKAAGVMDSLLAAQS